jgi:type III secretory pathway component EscT
MLEGIHILNQTTMWTSNIGNLIGGILIACLLISFAICIIADLFNKFSSTSKIKGIVFLVPVLFFLIPCYKSIYEYFTKTSYQQYQVTIDNTVSMKEFNTKYKVIDHKGDIYTIEEIR